MQAFAKEIRCTILAVGDLPEGGAVSVRLKLLAAALRLGSIPTRIALLHATTKRPLQENHATQGETEGIPFIYLNGKTLRPRGVFAAAVDTLGGITAAVRLVARQRTDGQEFLMLYTPRLFKFFLPLLIAKLRGVPVIVEACEIWSKSTDAIGNGILRRLVNSGDTYLEQLTPRLAVGVIAISGPIREYYRNMGATAEQVYLLPILVDAARYIARSTSEVASLAGKKYFLNSGSFAEKDGVPYILAAFESVATRHADLYLVFTGHVAESARAEALGKLKPEIVERILFTGFLGRDELVWAYQNARALLSCRSNSAYANYGLPTKLCEYLASGSPVIATRVGDTPYYLQDGENAFLAQPEEAASIAECMERVLNQPGLARQIGENGRRLAEREFHYAQHAQHLAAFVRRRIGLSHNE